MEKTNFNSNQFTPLSGEVQAAMKTAFAAYSDTLVEGYGVDYKQFSEIEQTKELIAQSINVSTNELYFTHGGKESDVLIIDKAVFFLGVKLIITSVFESKEKLEYLKHLELNGFVDLYYIPCSKYGELKFDVLSNFLESNSKNALISLSHANIYTGVLLPVKEVSRISKKHTAFFHLNAQLTFGRFQLSLSDTKPDFVGFDTVLLNGPNGIGCLVINEKLQVSDKEYNVLINNLKIKDTPNIALVAGLRVAIEITIESINKLQKEIKSLKSYFIEQLKEKLDIDTVDAFLTKGSLFNQLAFFLSKEDFGDFLLEKLDLNHFILPHLLYPLKSETERYFISVALNGEQDKTCIDGFISILRNVRNGVDKIS